MTRTRYHHGDLRRALIDAAVALLAQTGPADLSLRAVARQVGVSHAAPAHHFGDKGGLLTAIAEQGHRILVRELREAWEHSQSFLEVGVAYVRFAVNHRAHFEVMFRPELLRQDDRALSEARAASAEMLFGPVGSVAAISTDEDRLRSGIAAWALVHGVAELWLNGNLPPGLGSDPEEITRSVARLLFGGRNDAA